MKFTATGKDLLRCLIAVPVLISLFLIALFALLQQLDIGSPEPRQPCELMDSIELKLGETQVSFPVETNLLITEAEGPWHRRRRVKAKDLFFKACYDNKPFYFASSLDKTITFSARLEPSNNEIVKQWPSNIRVSLAAKEPRFMADGIYETKRFELKSDGSHRRDFTEQTGYKSDASKCYVLEKKGLEICSVYRYLKDVDLTISMYLNTSDVNLYGRSVYEGRQPSREYWPELMDREEKYWRAFIIENKASSPPD
jgi:hypothetical protein